MEVNKAFFMSTSYPHRYNKKMYFISTVLCFLFLLKKLPLISKIAEPDPTNNAADLFLPGLMSN